MIHKLLQTVSRSNLVVFVLGGPGSGKGTQCNMLARKFGFHHFSAGELLRKFASRDTSESHKLRMLMNEGHIVPAHVTLGLLQEELRPLSGGVCLIDGFPRNMSNHQAWMEAVKEDCAFAVDLQAPEAILTQRLLSRKEGRSDDVSLERISKRIETFRDSTQPVIDYYRSKDLLVEQDGSGPPDEVFSRLCQSFQQLIPDLIAEPPQAAVQA